jgi:hypothetical protein
MRVEAGFAAVFLCFSLSAVGQASSHCPDRSLQQASIGGDRIVGAVVRQNETEKFAKIRVYSSTSGKTVWVWTTEKDGSFTSVKLPAGSYRLEVTGWGSGTVILDPKLSQIGTQTVNWSLTLTEDGCIGAGASTN